MGSVESYETSAGRRYKVQYRRPDRSTTTKRGFRTKKDAQLYLAQAELRIAGGTWIDERAARATVGELGPAWLAAKAHLKPSSYAVLAAAWRIHVEPVWGARQIGSIAPSEVQDWVAGLTRRRSATVVIRAHGVLSGILERAVNDRQLGLNPTRGAALPRKGRKHRSYLTHTQVELLAREAREHRALVLLLAYTGLRWGEAVALRLDSVDFARERIVVRANAVNVAGHIIPGTPKSHVSRSVAFPHFLAASLQVECAGKAPGDLVFGAGTEYLPTPTHRDGWFAGARNRCVQADSTFPARLTLHDLRHTAASLAISAGANVKAVQRMLGHASAAMTLDTYADLFEDDLNDVAGALDHARTAAVAVKTQSRAGFQRSAGTRDPRNYAAEPGMKNGAPGGIRTPNRFLRTELLFH
ncbi:site-specific integrase [Amnibacterium soli]|uniref:Site-specific integrase n=1 Tax=Amnibacterium soli TaxID=1282736 RepID=A0ABP8ZB51_9MICO